MKKQHKWSKADVWKKTATNQDHDELVMSWEDRNQLKGHQSRVGQADDLYHHAFAQRCPFTKHIQRGKVFVCMGGYTWE